MLPPSVISAKLLILATADDNKITVLAVYHKNPSNSNDNKV